jgi:E3 ubiquitin-protein ligase ZNRF1/2
MGAKASTANGEGPSPRSRTFSASSSSEVVAGAGPAGAGFSFLRAIPSSVAVSSDRQRARSLSSVPDISAPHETLGSLGVAGTYDISESVESDTSSHDEHPLDSPLSGNISLGRVYAAHSLPTNIWSLNGELSCCLGGLAWPG